ncbi:MAG: hypothetical protein ACRBN8_29310 [Nannocystales bacterium]
MQPPRLTRKTFLRMSLGALAAGAVGCESDSGNGTDGAPSGTTGDSDPSTTGGTTSAGPATTTGPSTSDSASTSTGETSGDSSESGATSSSSSSGGGAPDCSENGATGAEFDLHDHTLEITADMLQADTALEGLAILGSGHPHSLDLTGAQVNALLAGESVTATTSFGSGHEHQVTLECL